MEGYDEKVAKESLDTTRRSREQEIADMRIVLGTPEGRRFFARLIAMTGIYEDSMTGNSYTFYNEGQRSIGLRLMKDLNEVSPDAYIQILSERKGVNNAAGTSSDSARTGNTNTGKQ